MEGQVKPADRRRAQAYRGPDSLRRGSGFRLDRHPMAFPSAVVVEPQQLDPSSTSASPRSRGTPSLLAREDRVVVDPALLVQLCPDRLGEADAARGPRGDVRSRGGPCAAKLAAIPLDGLHARPGSGLLDDPPARWLLLCLSGHTTSSSKLEVKVGQQPAHHRRGRERAAPPSALRFYEERGLIRSERAGLATAASAPVLRRIAFIVFAQRWASRSRRSAGSWPSSPDRAPT